MSPGTGVTLDGPRVRLRTARPEEYDRLLDWYNDPETVAPFDRFELTPPEEFRRELEAAAGDPDALAPRFVIERRSDSKLLGFVGFYRPHPVLSLTDVWYVLGATEERGRGFGSEAVALLVDHLFERPERPRVGATCDIENVASVRLLERLGFRREGELSAALFHHARFHPVYIYGVTRAEWAARPRPPR
ncbi:MAG: GNAT family N-acetyltransferase [Thermoplasmata archaeon]